MIRPALISLALASPAAASPLDREAGPPHVWFPPDVAILFGVEPDLVSAPEPVPVMCQNVLTPSGGQRPSECEPSGPEIATLSCDPKTVCAEAPSPLEIIYGSAPATGIVYYGPGRGSAGAAPASLAWAGGSGGSGGSDDAAGAWAVASAWAVSSASSSASSDVDVRVLVDFDGLLRPVDRPDEPAAVIPLPAPTLLLLGALGILGFVRGARR